jgi:glycosyltransferase involved in cell wall biosynthesis
VHSPPGPRRLVYVTLEALRPGQASATHVREIVEGLREIGWQVELIAARVGPQGGAKLERVPEYLRLHRAAVAALAGADALYLRAHPAALPIARRARALGRRVFQEINGQPADLAVTYPWLRPLGPLIDWLYGSQLAAADHVFAVTEGLCGWARGRAGHGRVSLVPNGANTRLFRPEGPRAELGGRYVVFVGGLVAWHGVDTMLAAVRAPDWPGDVRLVVAGDGPERAALKAAAGDRRVVWLGRRPYEEVPALLRGALAGLCVIGDPAGRSASGVAPLKLYEAMACGLPVVASDLPFQRDLVERLGAGLVVPPGDAGALARAVASLAADPARARQHGARGAAFVRDHASWSARARDIAAIMTACLDATPNQAKP